MKIDKRLLVRAKTIIDERYDPVWIHGYLRIKTTGEWRIMRGNNDECVLSEKEKPSIGQLVSWDKTLYEGDIVEWDFYSDEPVLAVIVWSTDRFMMSIIHDPHPKGDMHLSKGCLYNIRYDSIKVVGNTTDNPGMLNP